MYHSVFSNATFSNKNIRSLDIVREKKSKRLLHQSDFYYIVWTIELFVV